MKAARAQAGAPESNQGCVPAARTGVGWIAAVLVVAGVAAALRFLHLGFEGLWCDEAYTAHLARLPLGAMISELLGRDDAPPLFYLLQRCVVAILGDGEAALRFIPALAGLAAVLVLLAAAMAHRSRARFWSAAFLAASAYAIFYARQARSYTLVMLLALAVVLSAEALLLAGRRRAGPVLGAAGILLCLTHHLGVLVVATSLVLWPLRGHRAVPLRSWLLWHAVPVALWILLWIAGPSQLGTHQAFNAWMGEYWKSHSLLLAPLLSLAGFVPGALPTTLTAVAFPSLESPSWFWPTVAGLAAVAGLVTAFARSRRDHVGDRESHDLKGALIEAGFVAVPLLALAAASLTLTPVYVLGRTDAIALPAFALLLGRGLARWPRGVALATVALWGVISLAALGPGYGWGSGPRVKGADRDLAAFMVADGLESGDWVVHGFLTSPSLEYYLRRMGATHQVAWFPDGAGRIIAGVEPTPLDSLPAFLAQARALRARMEARMANRDAVWVLALLGPQSPEPWLQAARPEVSAQDVAYPGSVLVYALAGGGKIPVRRIYRQDWVGGTRLLLRTERHDWLPIDSLPPLLAPGGGEVPPR